MFLELLNEAQRRAFLRVARLLVERDGLLDREEQRAFDLAVQEARLSPPDEVPSSLEELVPELAHVDSPIARRVVMMELMFLASVDGLVSESERTLLYDLADRLGVSQRDLGRLHRLAVRRREIREQARRIILGD